MHRHKQPHELGLRSPRDGATRFQRARGTRICTLRLPSLPTRIFCRPPPKKHRNTVKRKSVRITWSPLTGTYHIVNHATVAFDARGPPSPPPERNGTSRAPNRGASRLDYTCLSVVPIVHTHSRG